MAHALFLLDCRATLAMTKVLAVQGNNKSASPQATHKNVLRADLFTGLPRCAMLARNDTAGAVKQNRAVREGCGKDEVRRRHIFKFYILKLYHYIAFWPRTVISGRCPDRRR